MSSQALFRNLPRRTWPYGTRKQVTVISNDSIADSGNTYFLACLEKETGEGFVLIRWGKTDANPGDRGVITFKEGGPNGGYWDYQRAESQSL